MISNLTANYVLYFETLHLFNVHILLWLIEYWVHYVEYYQCMQMLNNMVLDEQSCIFRANYLQK